MSNSKDTIICLIAKQIKKTQYKCYPTSKSLEASKDTIICLIARQIKKTQYKCYPTPKSLEANVRAELDLPDYTTKVNLKNSGVDTSYFAKKIDLANLKSDVDKLDIDILKNVPIILSI